MAVSPLEMMVFAVANRSSFATTVTRGDSADLPLFATMVSADLPLADKGKAVIGSVGRGGCWFAICVEAKWVRWRYLGIVIVTTGRL